MDTRRRLHGQRQRGAGAGGAAATALESCAWQTALDTAANDRPDRRPVRLQAERRRRPSRRAPLARRFAFAGGRPDHRGASSVCSSPRLGQDAADERALDDLAAGRDLRLADAVGDRPPKDGARRCWPTSPTEGYVGLGLQRARQARRTTGDRPRRRALDRGPRRRARRAQGAERRTRVRRRAPRRRDRRRRAALPRRSRIGRRGARPGRAPAGAPGRARALRGRPADGLVIAVVVAVLIGFLVASAITSGSSGWPPARGQIAEGRLDEPLQGTGGRDEIGDLGRALDTMRGALRETFDALSLRARPPLGDLRRARRGRDRRRPGRRRPLRQPRGRGR